MKFDRPSISNAIRSSMAALLIFSILFSAASPLQAYQDNPAPESATEANAPSTKAESNSGLARFERGVDQLFGIFNGYVATVFFFPIPLNSHQYHSGGGVPLAVLWLVIGATYFTFRMNFINLRAFKHSILLVMGKYDDPEDEGEVTHFQALTAALSATVGLGNIAGVAIAIATGGPGAMFWMMLAGLLGMTSKFAECTLAQIYRRINPDGRVMGGPMCYLSVGLQDQFPGNSFMKGLGKTLAVFFAILCIGGSLAGGNSFQVKQSLGAVAETIPILKDNNLEWVYGIVMAFFVGIVIIGGIRSIARTTEKIVPLMCGIYILACLAIIIMQVEQIPACFKAIWDGAFSDNAMYGGFLGVLIIGFKRAAFSNEAGVGSAAIAHSAAKTKYPVREGIVASLGPFVDTIMICTMTALVMIITGAYNDPQYADLIKSDNGAALTSAAMNSQIPYFNYVLSVSVILFAYSTMISWSYYGERCWAFLFGDSAKISLAYRILFLIFVVLGSVVSATNILDFGDLMILGMAFPNILGVLLLSNRVKRELDGYWSRYKSGEFDNTTSASEGK
ncbi:alanine/glycine:cation symporter family protein [Gimesia maris]|uniref:Amino-acid carrier protein AlsT n=1 Tax=Gimesia maris TaxID=122 RepID=A0ABX5YHY7_9PLAN|nr:alanine/glycine:cation symporter family protein [Gimesia maris]QDT77742.1 Amino-acid carrier protein AlsT [Gimesia maris]QDU13405.1 Amino-acid carrier protein AlsT [Gimesia maris]QEG15332.1 Amino-acid carrier protein AlsT [Gimesia maris]